MSWQRTAWHDTAIDALLLMLAAGAIGGIIGALADRRLRCSA